METEQTEVVEVAVKGKSQPKVGRVWVNGNCISGYVIVGPNMTINFAGNLENSPAFLFLSKK